MTALNVLLPLLTCLVSLVFAGLVLAQWRQRHRAFQLVWGAGLTWYGISSGTQSLASAAGWDPALYRAWYLFGAIFVAAYLGMGTVYLLARSGFAYFAGVSIFLGGLFAYLSQLELIKEGRPAAWWNVALVVALAAGAGLAVIATAAWRRDLAPHVAMAILAATSLVVTVLTFTASLAPPGYATDAHTGLPTGAAMPGYLRILAGPFNIAGALCLVFGALFSAYVYMPKRKVLRGGVSTPVAGQLYRALAVTVNLVASIPLAGRAFAAGTLNSRVPATVLIALGGSVAGSTSGLDRFGVTWPSAIGELVGLLLIFAGFLVSEEVFRRLPFGLGGAAAWRRREARSG